MQPDRDEAADRREFDRVGQEVPENLLKPVRVTVNGSVDGTEDDVDCDAFGFLCGADRVERALDCSFDLYGFVANSKFSADDAGYVEQIFDDTRLSFCVSFNQLDSLL